MPKFARVALLVGIFALMSGAARGASSPDARVTAVKTSGTSGNYTFAVTIASNDTGCEHYVDWWEVVDEHAHLVYRRVLLHDHADEQPFTRDGGPVVVSADQVVTVRAHVNTSGYAAAAARGSVSAGFTPLDVSTTFASALSKERPLPDVC